MKPTGAVWVVTIGASTGFSVFRFADNAELKLQHEIPWITPGNGVKLWPLPWIAQMLRGVRTAASAGDIIAGAMPGADLMIWRGMGFTPGDVIHYPCIYDNLSENFNPLKEAVGRMGKHGPADLEGAPKIYRMSGGANVDQYQPYGQLLAYRHWYPNLFDNLRFLQIIPFCDYLTWLFTGPFGHRIGHDPVMLQDQGLLREHELAFQYASDEPGPINYSQLCEEATGIRGIGQRIVPNWYLYGQDELIEAGDCFIMPFTHDSVYARLAGRSASSRDHTLVIWTGTWTGTAVNDETECVTAIYDLALPLCEKHISVEGVGRSRSFITNSGMTGKLYKELVARTKLSYGKMASAVWQRLSSGSSRMYRIKRGELPDGHDEALGWLAGQYIDPVDMAAALVNSTANWVYEDSQAIRGVTGLDTGTEAILVGGWSQNMAFRHCLELYGFDLLSPPNAREATVCGVAAEARLRAGLYPTFAEALESLPELVLE